MEKLRDTCKSFLGEKDKKKCFNPDNLISFQAVKLGSTVNESVIKPTASKVCSV